MNKSIYFIALFLISMTFSAKATVVYVDSAHVGGTQNGTSWATAFSNLQSGINAANAGDSVWVVKGTYKPTPNGSFAMKEGVKIFGGFLNIYTNISQRNWLTNSTVLTGNGTHVIRNNANNLTNVALLDGFTITNGSGKIFEGAASGGGVVNKNVSPTFRYCTFSSNFSEERGGAIYNSNASPIFDSCYFKSNWCGVVTIPPIGEGGAIYNNSSSPYIKKCIFSYNSAVVGGGAIYNNNSTPIIDSSLFLQNTIGGIAYVPSYGGAICNFSSSSTINNCAFTGNSTWSATGGAIYNYNSPTLINLCTFQYNSGEEGAAIHNNAPDSANTQTIISHCSFTNNNSSKEGTIYNNNSYFSIRIEGCTFSNNAATYKGGAIANYGSEMSVDSCVFTSNTVTNGSFWDDGGGALYNNSKSLNNFSGDTAHVNITNSILTENKSSSSAGAIMNTGNLLFVTIDNCKFIADTSYNGGAIFNDEGPDLVLNNVTFNKNMGYYSGGAISNRYYSNLKAVNTLFDHNYSLLGGAVANVYTNTEFFNCTIVNNTSVDTTYNGVIATDDSSTCKIANSILWGNNIGIVNYGPGPSVSYSLVQGVPYDAGLHILADTTNPLFMDTTGVGDYHLQANSPCINAGYNDSLPANINIDIESNPRISGGFIDMGAYERLLPPLVDLADSAFICDGDSILLNAQNYGCTYLWNTGDTSQIISVLTSGTYFVTVTNSLGSSNDTIQVFANTVPAVNLGNDITTGMSSITLDAGNPGSTYLWSTNATTQTITATTTGTYSVMVINDAGCNASDTIKVTFQPIGINEINKDKNTITIFPNPSKEMVHISFTNEKLLHTKAILNDIYGRTVREVTLNGKSTQFSFAGLSAGMYVLKTIVGDSVKIVKE